jgi:hypothetical protein
MAPVVVVLNAVAPAMAPNNSTKTPPATIAR